MQSKRVYCDFDNTISEYDVTDAILEKFADPSWEAVEEEWLAGKITARECMEKQISLIRASREELDSLLDNVPIAHGFAEFVEFCKEENISLAVVSDGLDYSINKILANNGFHIPVWANKLIFEDNGAYKLEHPHANKDCPSGMCKCATVAMESSDPFIHIGDGKSDFCIANKANFVIAKKNCSLEARCEEKHMNYASFSDFFDVTAAVKNYFSILGL